MTITPTVFDFITMINTSPPCGNDPHRPHHWDDHHRRHHCRHRHCHHHHHHCIALWQSPTIFGTQILRIRSFRISAPQVPPTPTSPILIFFILIIFVLIIFILNFSNSHLLRSPHQSEPFKVFLVFILIITIFNRPIQSLSRSLSLYHWFTKWLLLMLSLLWCRLPIPTWCYSLRTNQIQPKQAKWKNSQKTNQTH